MTIAEIIERALPCTNKCAIKSDWPIEAHYMHCPAYHRDACRRAVREALLAAAAKVESFGGEDGTYLATQAIRADAAKLE